MNRFYILQGFFYVNPKHCSLIHISLHLHYIFQTKPYGLLIQNRRKWLANIIVIFVEMSKKKTCTLQHCSCKFLSNWKDSLHALLFSCWSEYFRSTPPLANPFKLNSYPTQLDQCLHEGFQSNKVIILITNGLFRCML